MTNKVLLRTIWDTGRLYREVSATQGENTVKGLQVIKARVLSTDKADRVRIEFVDCSRGVDGTFETLPDLAETERDLRTSVMAHYDHNEYESDSELLAAVYKGI